MYVYPPLPPTRSMFPQEQCLSSHSNLLKVWCKNSERPTHKKKHTHTKNKTTYYPSAKLYCIFFNNASRPIQQSCRRHSITDLLESGFLNRKKYSLKEPEIFYIKVRVELRKGQLNSGVCRHFDNLSKCEPRRTAMAMKEVRTESVCRIYHPDRL